VPGLFSFKDTRMTKQQHKAAAKAAAARPSEPLDAPIPPFDTQAAEQAEKPASVVSGGSQYVLQWAIKTGGVRYAIGDVVTLTADQAAPFLASGAITSKG
jgi:hypothetical protein